METPKVFQSVDEARVAELADAQDLGSCAERREGSSPSSRIASCRQFSAESTTLGAIFDGLVRPTTIAGTDRPETSPDQNVTSTRLDRIRSRIAPLRNSLLSHRIYQQIDGLDAVCRFMEFHVFAVWDFMSLLKALQRNVCCVNVPWTPPENPRACRLVNQIVLGEESDQDEAGNPCSHFELYRRAMRRCGADTGPIDGLIEAIRGGSDVRSAAEVIGLPAPVGSFLSRTFGQIESGDVCAIASAFTFGREGLLPDVFRRIVDELGATSGTKLDLFRFYLDRHIDVDDGEHGPMAERLVEDLCGDDPARWQSAEDAAIRALEARLSLWDGIGDRLDGRDAGSRPS